MHGLRISRLLGALTALGTLLVISTASAQSIGLDVDGSMDQSDEKRDAENQGEDGVPNLTEFSVRPNQCVALRKGQVCYQRVLLHFKAPSTGDFCLHVEDNDEPVHCWTGVAAGRYRYELESSENVNFTLHDHTGRVAEAEVTIAWVYKSSGRRRTSWRIF